MKMVVKLFQQGKYPSSAKTIHNKSPAKATERDIDMISNDGINVETAECFQKGTTSTLTHIQPMEQQEKHSKHHVQFSCLPTVQNCAVIRLW